MVIRSSMIMTNQEIINIVIEKLRETGKLSLRGDDLYRIFITGKELESPQADMLPGQFIEADFVYFKIELLDYLTRNKVYYISGENGFLDIFICKEVFDDYKYVYMAQEDIDRLNTMVIAPGTTRDDRIRALEYMYDINNKKSNILKKYGE